MSNDNSFNNETRYIRDNEFMLRYINSFLSNPEDNNINDLHNILNNILFDAHGYAHLNAKDYFRKISRIFNITKKIMDNTIQRNLIERHDPLYEDQVINLRNNVTYDYIINNYVSLLYEVVNRNEENDNKYAIQCDDFIKQFGEMYDFTLLPNIKKYDVVLEYPKGQSPKETAKQVLDNPDEEFIIPYSEVSSLKSERDW